MFVLFSVAAHAALLAPWPAPAIPKFRATAILSVDFTAGTGDVAVAAPTARKPTGKQTGRETNTEERSRARHRPRIEVENRRARAKSATDARRAPARKPKPRLTRARVITTKKTTAAFSVTPPPEQVTERARREPPRANRQLAANRMPPASADAHVSSPAPVARPSERANGASSTANARETARARIRGRLQTNLSRYFSYPALARRRGWQGYVRVEFTVEPDGRLTNLRVARSSGYAVLDSSALKALGRVESLEGAPGWLNGRAIDIELPVIFRLEDD